MHYGFKCSQLQGEVVAAIDINTVANIVYAHNFLKTSVLNTNIQGLSLETLEKLNINTILMSPPCQPHSRVGNKRDVEDHRSDALLHLCTIMPQLKNLNYILLENVKGFESSKSRDYFVQSMMQAGFFFREFILSPTQFGVPNTRHRYYYIGRKLKDFSFDNVIWLQMPECGADHGSKPSLDVSHILETKSTLSDFYLTKTVLNKRIWVMDIVTNKSTNTMCFTKAYTRYSEGTGSVFSPLDQKTLDDLFAELKLLEQDKSIDSQNKRLEMLESLQLRYFSPREIARLMSFPDTFDFPVQTTNKQKYRLLGNSVNILVISELLKLMCT